MQMPNSSSLRLNVESVSVDPLVPVRVPAPLGVRKSLASLSFCNLAGWAKGKQAGSVYGQEGGEGAEQKADCRKQLAVSGQFASPSVSQIREWESVQGAPRSHL